MKGIRTAALEEKNKKKKSILDLKICQQITIILRLRKILKKKYI